MSRVIPALLTRMANGPAAFSAAATSAIGGGGIAEVGDADVRPVAQISRQGLQSLGPRARKHHRRALGVQRPRNRRADAARSACDQRRPSVQPEHRRVLRGFSALLRSRPAWPPKRHQHSGAMRRTRPASTLPAPSSTKLSTPSATIASTLSRQRTVAVTWRTSRSLISTGSVAFAAETLAINGTIGARGGLLCSASAIASAAGAISAQWNGAETGSSMARRTPRILAISTARSTAPRWPEITICPPPLSFAGSITSRWPVLLSGTGAASSQIA